MLAKSCVSIRFSGGVSNPPLLFSMHSITNKGASIGRKICVVKSVFGYLLIVRSRNISGRISVSNISYRNHKELRVMLCLYEQNFSYSLVVWGEHI